MRTAMKMGATTYRNVGDVSIVSFTRVSLPLMKQVPDVLPLHH